MPDVDTEIQHAKAELIRKAREGGLFENFGLAEVQALEDRFRNHKYTHDGIWAKIRDFDEWCMTYTGGE